MQRNSAIVSTIMPAFNAGLFISEAIDSIRKQTLKEWELIVVDDGSTDSTAEIVVGHGREDARVRLIRIRHQGIAAALNVGLEEACAPILARMDSDDVSLPDRLVKQVEFLGNHPEIGVVSCGVELIERRERSEGLQAYVDWVNSMDDPELIKLGRFVDAPVIHPTVCFRKELVARHGGYLQGNFPEDYELWLRWLQAGVQFAKVPGMLLKWRDHSEKLTRTDHRYREEALWEIKGRYFSSWYLDGVNRERDLLIWGSGRKSRSRLFHFSEIFRQKNIRAFIDVDRKKIGQTIDGIPVISPEEVDAFYHPFVIGIVGSRGARTLIQEALMEVGMNLGVDFIFLA